MSTELQARAEVVGYSEVVLEAIRALVWEIDADPELASVSGLMMAATAELYVVQRERVSTLMANIAHVLTTAAEVALTKKEVAQ